MRPLSLGSFKDPGVVKPPVFSLWSKEPPGIFHCQLFYNSVTFKYIQCNNTRHYDNLEETRDETRRFVFKN